MRGPAPGHLKTRCKLDELERRTLLLAVGRAYHSVVSISTQSLVQYIYIDKSCRLDFVYTIFGSNQYPAAYKKKSCPYTRRTCSAKGQRNLNIEIHRVVFNVCSPIPYSTLHDGHASRSFPQPRGGLSGHVGHCQICMGKRCGQSYEKGSDMSETLWNVHQTPKCDIHLVGVPTA
ncbi:hypothetical protein DEU56DRAFT_242135 [Suillus clintonianus]|uniref:uncharacterized protein n=1 Tax=Suillus clintonianus TaxID=1904413 RepID=UPI001B8836EB|nr:uncharacterized protein DEU56DRAFT_242135 [Suillus clintonianus]KAG2110112.1 hypothetical protein DEU56DRAFT_242135 [Suillus clintonianus]